MEDDLLTNFYLKQSEPNQSCFLVLRKLIKDMDPEIVECLKYGCPCFLYGKKILCYLWKDKKTHHPYILFSDGVKMNNPVLEFGGRKKMKSFTIDPNKDIDSELIKILLNEAIALKKK